ncbi:MAG: dihydrofolate reductase [Clostridia bacterium]|jgi:dihydrofolate reductase|nr:dihydrofolate reductase [Clostridia bacterium]MDD4571143.1 dihydrofolate reductase [Clostridia bacterium]
MNLIVAVDNNWGIGCQGDLLFHIPADMKFFKSTTTGKIVVMGDLTLKSLPHSKPLPNRTNIVLSSEPDFQVEGAIICHSLAEFFELLSKYKIEDVFIIGGAAVYNQLLPYCEYAYITKVNSTAKADKYLDNVDDMPNWQLLETSSVQYHNELEFTFNKYVNNNVKQFQE